MKREERREEETEGKQEKCMQAIEEKDSRVCRGL